MYICVYIYPPATCYPLDSITLDPSTPPILQNWNVRGAGGWGRSPLDIYMYMHVYILIYIYMSGCQFPNEI